MNTHGKKRMKSVFSNRGVMTGLMLMSAIMSTLIIAWSAGTGYAEQAETAISWLKVEKITVPTVEEVVGNIHPKMVTTLSSKVMGNVLAVEVREGDTVKAGDLVVRIDAKDIGSDLAVAQAALTEAHAGAGEIDQHLAGATSARTSAEASLKLAQDSFARIEQLFAAKSVTQQEFDQAQNQLTQAQEGLRQADSQIAALRAKRAQIVAKAGQAKASMEKVSTIKNLAEVVAPFTGRVTKRMVEPGMLAAPGVPLLTLEDSAHVQFQAVVPERLLPFVAEGTELPVRVDALGDRVFLGRVEEIVPSVDPYSHTFQVKIAIEHDAALRTGMYARGDVVKGQQQVIVIPQSALERRGQLEGVYINHNQRPVFHLVRTGVLHPQGIEMLSGLNGGEEILLDAAAAKAKKAGK